MNSLRPDDNLTVRLRSFQGRLLRLDGSLDNDGLARENIKSFKPQADPNYSDQKTHVRPRLLLRNEDPIFALPVSHSVLKLSQWLLLEPGQPQTTVS